MSEVDSRRAVRTRIVEAAAQLLQEHGPGAVTTRGVADGAGVQAPTIYRLFGDKDGLLDAVAEHVLATFVTAKAVTVRTASAHEVDPLDDLRSGWRTYLDFGLANPALFTLLSDPIRAQRSPASRSGQQVLAARVHRLALAGRLAVSEQRAVDLIHAAGTGAVLTLLATPREHRDDGLGAEMLDAVLARILVGHATAPTDAVAAAAVALRAGASQLDVLSAGEQHVLTEWLDRVIAAR